MLVNGEWQQKGYDTKSTGGHFKRTESQFRNWVTRDGSPGESGKGGFKAEPNRYHLYVSLACPWAHRTLIFRKLKKLEDLIPVSIVDYHMGENGWGFRKREGGTDDPLYNFKYLYELYLKADAKYTGRVTVPVLWDKQQETIVSNESAEIIRMFNSAFDELTGSTIDLYPMALRKEIDEVNDKIYNDINNGVYKAGFATAHFAYDSAVIPLFETLDELDRRLENRRYLVGNQMTEADWRLFPTLFRFDPVYHGHFKCNVRRIEDYVHLSAYLRDLYQTEGIKETCNLNHIKKHYYGSHSNINPSGIIPLGPEINLDRPHFRDQLSKTVGPEAEKMPEELLSAKARQRIARQDEYRMR